MKKQTSAKLKTWAKNIAVCLFWILIWQIIYMVINQQILIASPFQVLKAIINLSCTSKFWTDIGISVIKIMGGFAFAIVFGILLAVLSYKISLINTLLSPIINIIKATPVASFIILALIWIKSEYIATFISFLMVLPLVYKNIYTGTESTDKNLLEMSIVYRLSSFQKLKFIYFQSVKPYLISAVYVGIGFAWKSGVAAEVLGITNNSIGFNLYEAKVYLETENLFAWTVVIIIISVVFEKLIMSLVERLKFKK